MKERAISALGMLVMMGIAYALCPRDRRKHVRVRTIGIGFLILIAIAVIVLRTPATRLFSYANIGVERLLGMSREGASFVFGKLVTEPPTFGFIFAFQVLPTILFFSALMSVLYHFRIMPAIVSGVGRALSKLLGTSGAETFSTVADVFVGQAEAPLVVRPYIARMTHSELNACLVAGFATTAGGVLAAYVAMLSGSVPGIAGHLIACSVMSAPASIIIAKLMMPETTEPETAGHAPITIPRTTENALDAIATGTLDGVRLAVNVAAMLIVFLAFTALLNAFLGWVSGLFGVKLSFEIILGYVFAPLAWVMGIPSGDIMKVGALLGEKTVLNEFVAYSHMAREFAQNPEWLSERGRLIAAYALCGFANFGSIGIQIGGYSGLAPERRADLSRLAFRAMIGGLLATCLVACVAGVLV